MQPSPDYLGISRRTLDVEDYIDIIRRHRAWIIGPTFVGLVLAVVVAFFWPDTYVSYAMMRITPAQIPERIVQSNFNMQMAERLNGMLQSITSRDNLIAIIKKYNLYESDLKRQPMEDVVEAMKKKIQLGLVDRQGQNQRGGSAFRVSFSYENRLSAQSVVRELVAAFTNQNLMERRRQSVITTDFLSEELKNAKDNLDKLDAQMTAFRMRNTGQLPDERQANVQTLNSLQMQMVAVTEALHRDDQDKLLLETQLQNLKNQVSALSSNVDEPSAAAAMKSQRLLQLEKAIQDGELGIAALRERYRDEHPDIRNQKANLELLKRERDSVAKDEEKKTTADVKPAKVTNPAAARAIRDLEGQMESVKALIRARNNDIAEKTKAEASLNASIRSYQGRIQSSPIGESEFGKLSRDWTRAKTNYDELVGKKGLSEMANKLEERSAGENLELLDQASLPQKPTEPNRWLIIGMGTGLGMVLGVFLTGAREMKDTSLKNLKDVRAYTNLNVLTSVPLLENALVVRRKRRLAWLAWSSATIMGFIVMSSSMYYYYFGKQ